MVIWDDCYNSNPEAACMMLDLLAATPARRRIAVLGEMLELGKWSEELHRSVGRHAVQCEVSVLVGIRGAARHLVDEARGAGLTAGAAYFFDEPAAAGQFLKTIVRSGDCILFKGSRGTHVEVALEEFLALAHAVLAAVRKAVPDPSAVPRLRYVTVRTFLASITALLVAILAGPWMIRRLRAMQIGQPIREDGPETHLKKAGTPTMGGLLIITAIVVPTLLFANLTNPYVWVALLGLLGFGAVGFLDDYAKIRRGAQPGADGAAEDAVADPAGAGAGPHPDDHGAAAAVLHGMNVPFFKSFRPGLLIGPLMRNIWTWPLAFLPSLCSCGW